MTAPHPPLRPPSSTPSAPPPRPAAPTYGDLNDELMSTDWWTDELVARAGIPIIDVPLASVGGGLGSFVLADYLRIAGLPVEALRVLTMLDRPHQTYEYLCENSQIPRHERLRSDSGSTPDNIWGFPSYAVREALADRSLSALFNVLVEPIGRDYYTPRAGQVFEALDKEAQRIGWPSMLAKGQVRMVRRRVGGGYFTILTPPSGTAPTKRLAYRSLYVHIAVGYPALRFLPDLQRFRDTYGQFGKVVNAYEPHDHIYEDLKMHPGVVVVRGSGIVASRILQRLLDDREQHGAQTHVIHLFRTYVSGPQGDSVFMRRPGGNGVAYQGFNVAKAAWGGQLRDKMLKLEGEERAAFAKQIGGTNIPRRRSWMEQLERGRRGGWYQQAVGQVDDVVPGTGDKILTRITDGHGRFAGLEADYIIDATGLEGGPRDHRLLADLLDHGGAGLNPSKRLDVEPDFEVRGTRNQPGRLFASGSATFGGYYGGVDSFLGLQYAALHIVDHLAGLGFCPRITTRRSVSQWWKWMKGRQP